MDSKTTYEGSFESNTAFRRKRFNELLFPLLGAIHRRVGRVTILDVGGSVGYWEPFADIIDRYACKITLLNLDESNAGIGRPRAADTRFSFCIGDARRLDAFKEGSFDLVHSNSVIEHVGTWLDMRTAAAEIRRVAKSYYVQVPYYWFPVEPHFRAVFFHWLPEQVRYRLLMKMPCGHYPRALNIGEAMEWVQRQQLLDRGQMAALFPDADVKRETIWGLTKSLVAIRTDGGPVPEPR